MDDKEIVPDLLEMQSPEHEHVDHCEGRQSDALAKDISRNLTYSFVNTQTAREQEATSVLDIQTLFFTYAL